MNNRVRFYCYCGQLNDQILTDRLRLPDLPSAVEEVYQYQLHPVGFVDIDKSTSSTIALSPCRFILIFLFFSLVKSFYSWTKGKYIGVNRLLLKQGCFGSDRLTRVCKANEQNQSITQPLSINSSLYSDPLCTQKGKMSGKNRKKLKKITAIS
jgi:hypothetical protein